MAETRTVSIRITGRVQGVGYRAWTQALARRLDLSGHVRNCPDGSLAALASGPAEAVASLLRDCAAGPPGARVEQVEVSDTDEVAAPGFTIRAG